MDEQLLESLEKKCPRCGGSSANSSNPAGRCSACLKKLASNKKKPGHWQRAQTKADDALRRQKGKNGTAHKKSSGLGSRDSIVKQTQSAEKKTGQKLSPDRKNNGKGYAASNTRMVPEKLNRGRHHVDGKKLRAWQNRLKKTDISDEDFYTLVLAKALEIGDQELVTLLDDMHYNDLANFINNEDESEAVEPIKKIELLDKGAMKRLAPNPTSIKDVSDFEARPAHDLENKPRTIAAGTEHEHTTKAYPRPTGPTEDADEKRHQIAAVKFLHNHLEGGKNSFKRMINPNSGKEELHMLLHRGMDYEPDFDETNSPFTIKDNKIGHKGEGMWTTRKAAASYGDLHSAWIPVSHIKKFGGRIPGQIEHAGGDDDRAKDVADTKHMHFLVKPGMYNYANFINNEDQE